MLGLIRNLNTAPESQSVTVQRPEGGRNYGYCGDTKRGVDGLRDPKTKSAQSMTLKNAQETGSTSKGMKPYFIEDMDRSDN